MSRSITFQHTLEGYLVGPIWAGCEAHKPFAYNVALEDKLFLQPGSLRDHLLRVTNDGDFVSCEVADASLVTKAIITKGSRRYVRERVTPLERCKSVADMVRVDWEGPSFED